MRHEEAIGPNSPLYLQLRELIRGKIEGGEYPPGTAIPSVGTLAETYGIHRLSVRSAISALIGEGALEERSGQRDLCGGGQAGARSRDCGRVPAKYAGQAGEQGAGQGPATRPVWYTVRC